MPAHGSGPMWFATPSSQWTCTIYSLPVSRRTQDLPRLTGAAQVKRRLRNVALAGRNMYVTLYRELRKRKPDEVPMLAASTDTGAEERAKTLIDLEPAEQPVEAKALQAA
jgi:hypothetical protein